MTSRRALANQNGGSSSSAHSKLLAAAAHLFRAQGYSGTTTRELASLMGIQKASLYHHMGRKEDLLYELAFRALTRAIERADEVLAGGGSAKERLRDLIIVHVVDVLEEGDQFATTLIEIRALDGPRRAHVLQLRDAYEGRICDLVREAQAVGDVPDDRRAGDLTRILLGTMNHPVFWNGQGDRRGSRRTAEMIADQVMDGLLRRPQPVR
jgi:AcrR family transcriptional regulator